MSHTPLIGRRQVLAGAAGILGLALASPARAAHVPPFGRYGSPRHRLNDRTLYVDSQGRGDYTTVQAAVDATPDSPAEGWTLVIAAGTYRETVLVPQAKTGLCFLGATGDARDVVIVYDNAAGTPKPDGGTYGTSGSATATIQADGFTAAHVTFANDWLRADHPEITDTQAVAAKVMGDRSYFERCRFLGHQDTLYADTRNVATFARQYYRECYIEGDVDFVFGRATAVFERCELTTLARDVTFRPYGFVFAPSTAAANPHGFLAVHCVITGRRRMRPSAWPGPGGPAATRPPSRLWSYAKPGWARRSTPPRRTWT